MNVLVRNWELKLVSLVVASMFWLFVVSGERGEVALSVPIEYLNVPSGLQLSGSTPDTVDVQVRGLRSSLARLGGGDVRAQVDLARLSAGETVVRLGPDGVVAPRDVTVLRVSPSRLHLALEPVVTVALKVLPRVTGAPESGYRAVVVAVDPAVVKVQGPRSEVSGRSEVRTMPIDVTGMTGRVTRSVELEAPGGAVRLATTRTVDVTVLVQQDNRSGERRSTR
jgi:hypothetical protein